MVKRWNMHFLKTWKHQYKGRIFSLQSFSTVLYISFTCINEHPLFVECSTLLSLHVHCIARPKFDKLVAKSFDGHFLKMYVIWHKFAKTDIQILKMKTPIDCYIVIHVITIKGTQRYTNKHNHLIRIMKYLK